MPRNPHGGIEDRCLTGVNRDRVAQVGQLRVTVDELREELATRLGMLRKGDQELRTAMAVAAGRAKKAAKQRKCQEARARRAMLDNFGLDPQMWGAVRQGIRHEGGDMHTMPLEGKALLNQAETLSQVYRDRRRLQGGRFLIRGDAGKMAQLRGYL